MRQVSKLDKAKAQIVMDHPFFSSILLSHQITEDKNIPTLCVTARGDIYYNPEFIESLTVPQIVWALCHEVGHVIGQHATRRKYRHPKKWNYAGDAWINDMLNQANVGVAIPDTVNMPGSQDKTTETIYDELPDLGDNSSSGGDGSGDQWNNGIGDDISNEPLTESEINEIEAVGKVQLAQAAQAAKARGKLPGVLAKIVADILDVKTPWYDILERRMLSHVQQDYTWTRPNRRFIGSGVYLPSVAKQPSMGVLALQIDVSGSISSEELKHYNGHIQRIVKSCRPEKVHVLYTDTNVLRHDEFDQDEEFQIDYFSGGGTDMCAGFRYLESKSIFPDVFVTLTDGYTPFPDKTDCDSVWCISTGIKSPIGETVHFEMST